MGSFLVWGGRASWNLSAPDGHVKKGRRYRETEVSRTIPGHIGHGLNAKMLRAGSDPQAVDVDREQECSGKACLSEAYVHHCCQLYWPNRCLHLHCNSIALPADSTTTAHDTYTTTYDNPAPTKQSPPQTVSPPQPPAREHPYTPHPAAHPTKAISPSTSPPYDSPPAVPPPQDSPAAMPPSEPAPPNSHSATWQ